MEREPATGQGQQFLLVDRQYSLIGTRTEYSRFISRVLTPTGVSAASELRIRYNPEYQQASLHGVRVVREGKMRDLTRRTRVRILQQEEELDASIQTGTFTALLVLDDVRVGDIVEYEYSVRGSNPIFGARHFGVASLSWEVPVERIQVRVLVPAGAPFFHRLHRTDAQMQKRSLDAADEYRLTLKDVTAVPAEPGLPYGFSPFAWVEFSQYESWRQVREWAQDLYNVEGGREAVRALARQLRKESSSLEDYVTRALFFVQNEIRYLGLEFGVNTHRPYSSAEVLERRFGDCKDKTQLLSQLLTLEGVEAVPALVSTTFREGVARDLPSPGSFDHVITRVRLGGKTWWLDPTRSYQAGALDRVVTSDYGYALVVAGGVTELEEMFVGGRPIDTVEILEDIHADDFGSPVSYKVTSTFTGGHADYQRYRFANKPLSEIQADFLLYMKSKYKGAQLEADLHVEDDVRGNTFRVRESYRIEDYWRREGDYVVAPVKATGFPDYVPIPEMSDRQWPFYQGAPLRVTNVVRLHFPEEVSLRFDEPGGTVSHHGLEYSYTDHYEDRLYTFTAGLERTSAVVQAEDYASLREGLANIRGSLEFSLRFRDPGSVRGYREMLRLKARLTELAR